MENNLGLFYLLGAYKGDGSYNLNRNSIRINLTDIDFLNLIQKTWFNVFGYVTKIKPIKVYGKNSKPQWTICLYKKDFFDNNYHNLLPSTKEEKIEYLKGLFDAEGYVGIVNKRIIRKGKTYNGKDKFLNLSQKNQKDLDLWASWLNELGIGTTKLYRKDSRSRINIRRNEFIKLFADLINFRIKRKKEILNKIINNFSPSPLSKKDQEKIVRIYNFTNIGSLYLSKLFNRNKTAILRILNKYKVKIKKSHRKINANDIDIAELILEREFPFEIINFKTEKFSLSGLETSKIKSIKFHSKVKGYDLYTPTYNNFFLSNGILSHNSVLAMQIGAYWNQKIKELYGFKCPFDVKTNFVFSGKDLIKKGNELGQKYSYPVLVYDEAGADLEGKKVMQTLTQDVLDFFRECGQYNMFNIIVLPEYFDLPKGIALSRSIFLLDVSYIADDEGIFQRGYFNFYSRPNKKKLYLKGKKELNYQAYHYDFHGRFYHFYPVNEKEYRKFKQEALVKRESKRRSKFQLQRDACWFLLADEMGWSQQTLATRMEQLTGIFISQQAISDGIKHYRVENE